MKRRAFIMPLVLLLTMAITVIIATLIERQSAHSLTSHRQIGQYEAHHVARSINSSVEAWLQTVRGKSLRDMLDNQGKLVEIRCEQGFGPRSTGSETMVLYLKDAQDTVRTDFSGLTGQSLQDARKLATAAKDVMGESFSAHTRGLGPIQISASSAPTQLLEAAITAATDSSNSATNFIQSLMTQREKGPLTAQAFNQAVVDGGFTPEQQAAVTRLIVADTTFWALRVDITSGSRVIDRYEGYLNSTPQGRGAGSGAATSRRGNVVGLKRTQTDQQPQP